MRTLNTLFAALAVAIATQSHGGQPQTRYELKDVIISSFQANPPVVTVAQGASSYTVAIGPRCKFTRTVNGQTRPISYEAGIAALRPGRKIDMVVRRTPQGIIAILIGL